MKVFTACFIWIILGLGELNAQAQSSALHVVFPFNSVIQSQTEYSDFKLNKPSIGIGVNYSRRIRKLNFITGLNYQKLTFEQEFSEDMTNGLGFSEEYKFSLLSVPFILQRSIYSAKHFEIRASAGLIYNYSSKLVVTTNSSFGTKNIDATETLGKGIGWSSQLGFEAEFFKIQKRISFKGGIAADIQLSKFYEYYPRIQTVNYRAPHDFSLIRPTAYLAMGYYFGH